MAESILRYYGRADGLSEKRPVRVLLKYVVEQQMEGLINTEMGRKYVSAATAVFGVGGAENLLSAFSKGAWQRLVRESKEVAMDLEMTEMCGAKPTGVEYLTYRQNGHGQAYWLGRAAGVVLWGKQKTPYRIVHMRSGAHLLGKVGRLFGVGDADGHCACGNGVRECPSHFAFGCVRTEVQREVFYGVLVNTMGRAFGTRFRQGRQERQWLEMMLWLDGDGPFDDEEFDRVLVAFVELVAGLLKAGRIERQAGGLGEGGGVWGCMRRVEER